MTQTESSDTKELDPGSCGDSCSSLPSPHLSLNALDTMQVPATNGNDASGKVLSAKKDSHFSNTSTNFNSSSAHGSCNSLEEGLATHSHMQLAKPAVEDAVLKTTKEMLDLGKANKHSQGTEILCENTEDQAALPGRPNLFRASQFGLRTVVEDTEEMDTTPSVKSKEIDKSRSSPLQHDNNPQKCDWNEKQEVHNIAHSPEKVAHGSPSAVSPNGQSSAESSPWSSPILIRRVAPQSIRNRARKALESSDTTSREEITNSCEIIEPSAKVESRRKSFRQVPSVAVESDSDSDPVTESEAEELLRRAVQEEDSEEAAVIFAKRAVAPLEASKKSHTSQLQASKRAFWSPEKRHSTQRPTQQSGTPSQGKYHGLWKKHDSSTNDGDGSENTGGHSLATTLSSTLSEGLDQTLKEKRLEQDIEKMKKQMMMLENELQKTTAGKSTTESHSRKDSGASNDVVAMHGKENNWDWDDSDGADEVMDVVPPTPPRKPRKSSSDGSFCSTRK
ncbi:hypothetical protein HPB50_020935 [Hyalomma asiaticum]|uniref:Uncharacterized protein n=1 Tax=Hyalomma asiaticum TaxID=266040 RepID=A0ACB7T449_HYAAI|nr:hypothetical protein HPB50_020935 [Hyalomma asiaticum]